MDASKKDDGDKIFNAIVEGKEKNTTFIKQAKEVIEEARKLLAKGEDDARKSLKGFKDYVNTRSDAKTAVNKALIHTKKGNKGYVDAALEHGKEANKTLTEAVNNSKVAEAKTRAEAKTNFDNFKKTPDYNALGTDNKKLFDNKIGPWGLLRGALLENSEQEVKDLAPIVKKFIENPDIKTAFGDSETIYKDLKEKLEKLEKFQKSDKFKNLIKEDKDAFELLTSELKTKVSELAKKYGKTSSDTPEKPPFYKTALGITLIAVAVVAVLGGIA